MVRISAVVITFNEEKNIGRCIDSLEGVADEIVVLDSFSKDKTEEICRKAGAAFFQHIFDGHIEQKNRAITHAHFPHILSIDADEALSQDLKTSILEAKKNWKRDGYYMNRLTNYCGKWIHHSGWYPDRKLRLFDSRKGEWRGTNPHDKYEMFEGDKATGFLNGDLLHYSYYSVDGHYRQAEYHSDIAAKAYFREGRNSSLFNLLFNPALKFIRNYFFKLGFLDGWAGFTVCRITAWETYLKYQKLRNIWKEKSPITQ